jgi:hypothetical protein
MNLDARFIEPNAMLVPRVALHASAPSMALGLCKPGATIEDVPQSGLKIAICNVVN